jgi:hypothetical protein
MGVFQPINKAKLIAAAAMASASAIATRFGNSPNMASDYGPAARPAGGVRLVQVPENRLDGYLAGKVRDQRSFPYRNHKGETCRPSLRYFTHVNYSHIYKPAKDGQRECVRRRPAFYADVAQDLAAIQQHLEGTA